MKWLTCILVMALSSSVLVGRGMGVPPNSPAPPASGYPAETIPVGPAAQLQSPPAAESPGTAANVVVPELIRLLADPRGEVRAWAADSLGKLGPDAKAAVPALSGLARDGQPAIRQAAADALARMGPAAEKAAPALAALVRDPTWAVRHAAAAALIEIGPAAKAVVSPDDAVAG